MSKAGQTFPQQNQPLALPSQMQPTALALESNLTSTDGSSVSAVIGGEIGGRCSAYQEFQQFQTAAVDNIVYKLRHSNVILFSF